MYDYPQSISVWVLNICVLCSVFLFTHSLTSNIKCYYNKLNKTGCFEKTVSTCSYIYTILCSWIDRQGGRMVSMLDSGSSCPGSSPMLCSWLGQDTLLSQCRTPPSSINGYRQQNAGRLTCNGLASHPGGAILLVASCYRNWDQLWQLWATRLMKTLPAQAFMQWEVWHLPNTGCLLVVQVQGEQYFWSCLPSAVQINASFDRE